MLLASKHHCSPELNRVGLAVLDSLSGAGEGLRLALLEANSRLISSEPADADQQRSVTLALNAWKEARDGR